MAFAIVILFLALNLGVGLWQPKSARLKRNTTAAEEISDYFTAGRSVSSWIMGLTVACTIISGGSLIATPSLIYAKGLVGAHGRIMASGMVCSVLPSLANVLRLLAIASRSPQFRSLSASDTDKSPV